MTPDPSTIGERIRMAAQSGNDLIVFPLSVGEMAAIGRHLDGVGDAVDAHIYREFTDAVREWKGETS